MQLGFLLLNPTSARTLGLFLHPLTRTKIYINPFVWPFFGAHHITCDCGGSQVDLGHVRKRHRVLLNPSLHSCWKTRRFYEIPTGFPQLCHPSVQFVRFRSPLASVFCLSTVAGDTLPAAVLSIVWTACPREEVITRLQPPASVSNAVNIHTLSGN